MRGLILSIAIMTSLSSFSSFAQHTVRECRADVRMDSEFFFQEIRTRAQNNCLSSPYGIDLPSLMTLLLADRNHPVQNLISQWREQGENTASTHALGLCDLIAEQITQLSYQVIPNALMTVAFNCRTPQGRDRGGLVAITMPCQIDDLITSMPDINSRDLRFRLHGIATQFITPITFTRNSYSLGQSTLVGRLDLFGGPSDEQLSFLSHVEINDLNSMIAPLNDFRCNRGR